MEVRKGEKGIKQGGEIREGTVYVVHTCRTSQYTNLCSKAPHYQQESVRADKRTGIGKVAGSNGGHAKENEAIRNRWRGYFAANEWTGGMGGNCDILGETEAGKETRGC